MKRSKVILNNSLFSIPQFIEYVRNIVLKMTGNPNLGSPDVTLAVITTLCNALESKYLLAVDGGRLHKAEMRDARRDLESNMRVLALYVERKANGNETIIKSSGFNCSKQPVPTERPTFIVLDTKKEGSVKVKHKRIINASSWVWQYCADPITPSGWVSAGISTKCSCEIKGLKSSTKYWFRASYLTKDGQSDWCMPYSKIVL